MIVRLYGVAFCMSILFFDTDCFRTEAEGHKLSFAVYGDHDKQFQLLFHLYGGI